MAMLDNVTINQLRAFVAVCDQGSFSGAARELNRAQSAISHAIKALESAFDVELFERNTRKATLTAAGRSLVPDARAVISRTEEMKTRAVSILFVPAHAAGGRSPFPGPSCGTSQSTHVTVSPPIYLLD